jgi:xylulokinase
MSTLGGSLTWLRDKVWPETPSFAELEQLAAESQPGANRVLFLPYLSGERSPIWDADASGCWFGLRLDTNKADMVRAVFEGGAYGLRQILSRAEKHWGWRPDSLISVGGGTRSRIWHQIKADIVAVRYLPADLPDAAALGAAILAGIAAGVYEGIDDPNLPKVRPTQESVTPNPGKYRKVYDAMSRIYEDLYPSLKDCMSRIAQIGLSVKPT